MRKAGRLEKRGRRRIESGEPPGGEICNLLPHARAADQREPRGLFDGNRSGAADPNAARQDAATHVGNESKPGGGDDSWIAENFGAIGVEAGAPLENAKGGSICPPPDRLEKTGSFPPCAGDGESLARDCAPEPPTISRWGRTGPQFWIGLWRHGRRGESPPRLAVRQGTRAGRVRHHTVARETSAQREAGESDDRPGRTSLGLLERRGAFRKTGRAAARGSNRGGARFKLAHDLAVGGARRPIRPFPEHGLLFGEVRRNADPGAVAGRIGVKRETAEGQESWLNAEDRFFPDFYRHAAAAARRAEDTPDGPLSHPPPPVKREKAHRRFRSMTRDC
ncbi:hypothetical protein MOQ_009525 [Trypanosoma cruzi marinkellei]|uniref:Uncharacterized protein n=1 Tax=Trypanosoma cruzi marinkellei TaxID=85056 RepID=K2MM72_TRYCR|nr:hypothetical protein MOQ_009525 [Trypanosoma cruzi marinkellei]